MNAVVSIYMDKPNKILYKKKKEYRKVSALFFIYGRNRSKKMQNKYRDPFLFYYYLICTN